MKASGITELKTHRTPPQMLPPRLEMIVVALAAAAFMYQRSLGGSSGAATTIDGITFPADLQASGTKQVLCGGGTRLKFNVVKVYAVGLYFEPQAVTRGGGTDSLKPFVGVPAAELAKSSGFYDSLIAGVHTWLGAFPRRCACRATARDLTLWLCAPQASTPKRFCCSSTEASMARPSLAP